MGTNYYTRIKKEKIHLGKKSAGWKFVIRANDCQYYKNYDEYINFLVGKAIYSEYNRRISLKEFKTIIESSEEDDIYNESDIIISNYCFCNNDFS